jgi:peptide/nickel transport system substrate-binding protein
MLAEGFGSPHLGSFRHIQQIRAISPYEIDFILSRDDVLFPGRLTLGILPKNLIEQGHDFAMHPVGSNKARFVSLNEQRLTLVREDGIELRFVVVKDAMVRVLKLQNNELDCVQNDLTPELVGYCERHSALKVLWQKGSSYAYIGLNLDDPLLRQPALRQAIAHAIDRQQIIDAIFHGQARLAGGLLVPEHWAGHPGLNGVEYNPEKARALLSQVIDQDGQPIRAIQLSFKTSSDPTRIRLATLYQHQLKQVGIDLKIQSYDWGTFYNDIVKGRFQLFGLAWVGIKSPDIFQYVFDSEAIPPKGANRGRFRDAQVDAWIREAAQLQDLDGQADLYRQIQARLQSELPLVPLWFENQYAVIRKNIQGYQLDADGRYDSLLTAVKI